MVAVGALFYLASFPLEHALFDESETLRNQVWLAEFVVPMVAVIVAAYEWPRWRLVAGVALVSVLVPIACDRLERALDWDPPGAAAMAYLAVPATFLASVAVIAQSRSRRAASAGSTSIRRGEA